MPETGQSTLHPQTVLITAFSGRGYTAGVGEPMALFFKEIAQVYPEAKFLLNTRDPHDWYKSMRMAIIKPRSYLERPPISWIFSFFSIEQNKQLFHKVRSLTAARLGLNHSSWSDISQKIFCNDFLSTGRPSPRGKRRPSPSSTPGTSWSSRTSRRTSFSSTTSRRVGPLLPECSTWRLLMNPSLISMTGSRSLSSSSEVITSSSSSSLFSSSLACGDDLQSLETLFSECSGFVWGHL